MLQTVLRRHVRSHGGSAIALGGVVPGSDESDTGLTRQVGLWLGDFAGDEGVGTGGNGGFKKPLRPPRAPGHAANGPRAVPRHQRGGAPEHALHVGGQRLGIGERRRGHAAQLLFAKTLVGLPAKHAPQLRVVAQFGVGIERQVVGEQADVVRQQQAQALLHPAHDSPVLATPEQAVVHEQGIGARGNGSLDQGAAGRHAADDALDTVLALDLQTIRAVVLEALGLQQPVQATQQFVTGNAHAPIVSACAGRGDAAQCRFHCPH